MVEQTFRCPAYAPAKPGTSPSMCLETHLTTSRLAHCPIGAINCEAITRRQAQSVPGFLQKRKDIAQRRLQEEANRIG